MLKGKRVGMIVWGFIILFISIPFIAAKILFGVYLLVAGAGLFIAGIIITANVVRYNKALLEREGTHLNGVCFRCNTSVCIPRVNFRRHRNYPEGYARCPFCKQPLSLLMFTPAR